MANPSSKHIMSLRLPDETKQRLEKLAEVTGRSQSHLAVEAIKEYCNLQEWQLAAIQDGINAANEGQLISHEALKATWAAKRDKAEAGAPKDD